MINIKIKVDEIGKDGWKYLNNHSEYRNKHNILNIIVYLILYQHQSDY